MKKSGKKPQLPKVSKPPKEPAINKVPRVPVDVYFLARYFNRNERTIQLWVKEWRRLGMPPKERGVYNLMECIKWRFKQLEEELLENKRGGEDEAQSRARWMAARANSAEFELAMKHQEYLKISDAKFIWEEALLKLNTELDNIPQPASTETLGMDDPNEIESHLRERINEAKINIGNLADQAKDFAKRYSANILSAEESDTEAGHNDHPVGGVQKADAHRTARTSRKVQSEVVSA